MTKTEILDALKQMANIERLEIIEVASRLIRQEMDKNILEAKIPIEIEEGVTAYLNPNSAEAKALERLRSSNIDGQWSIVDEVGKDIDMDTVKEKFKQRGYKGKVSTTQTSTSGK